MLLDCFLSHLIRQTVRENTLTKLCDVIGFPPLEESNQLGHLPTSVHLRPLYHPVLPSLFQTSQHHCMMPLKSLTHLSELPYMMSLLVIRLIQQRPWKRSEEF